MKDIIVWVDMWKDWWDESAVCLNMQNRIIVNFQHLRDVMTPYLNQWVINFIAINCSSQQAEKVQMIVDEYLNNQ